LAKSFLPCSISSGVPQDLSSLGPSIAITGSSSKGRGTKLTQRNLAKLEFVMGWPLAEVVPKHNLVVAGVLILLIKDVASRRALEPHCCTVEHSIAAVKGAPGVT
ncbi:hypothetical protein FOZ62_012944, partial [Perkinsus olseni]